MRGPVPKRSDQRRRRNKSPVGIITGPGTTAEMPTPDAGWHHAAARWYESLAESGQSHWYEPSDWSQAWVLAELLSRALRQAQPSAPLVTAWLAGATELLTTEGARRRARLELQKTGQDDPDAEAAVSAMDEYRRRFTPVPAKEGP